MCYHLRGSGVEGDNLLQYSVVEHNKLIVRSKGPVKIGLVVKKAVI